MMKKLDVDDVECDRGFEIIGASGLIPVIL